MSGRWSDERGRGWEPGRGEGERDRWPGGEERSFGRGDRVFGERESGAAYNRPLREPPPEYAAGYRGRDHEDRPEWQDRDFAGVSPGFRAHERDEQRGYRLHPRSQSHDHPGGGRFYGDDGGGPIYRAAYRFGAEPGAPQGHSDLEDRAREAGEFFRRTGRRVANWFSDVAGEGSEMGGHEDRGHRGRGPKGYMRSDERISDDAHERLTDDPWLDASEIEVAVSGGEITLSGLVENRDAKHHAEHIVEHLTGVQHVQNNLRVKTGSYSPPPPLRTEGDAATETSANATGTTTRRN